MKKIILILVLLLLPSAAFAQCNGVFGASNVCGTTAAGPGVPGPLPLSSFALAPGGVSGNVQINNGTGGLAGINNTQFTALCQTFSSVLSGCVPASGGSSTSLFLSQAGTFIAPPYVAPSTQANRTSFGNISGSTASPTAMPLPTSGFNILYEGAIGTVCTGGNDTAAYTSAQTKARAAGGFIYIPTGSCRVDPNVINIDWAGGGIAGENPKNSFIVIRSCTIGDIWVQMGKQSSPPEQTFLRNISFEYAGPGYCTAQSTALFIDYVAGTLIYNTRFGQANTCVTLGTSGSGTTQTAGGITFDHAYFSCNADGMDIYSVAGTFLIATGISGYNSSNPNLPSPGDGVRVLSNADGIWADTSSVVQSFNNLLRITPTAGNAVEINWHAALAFFSTAAVRVGPTGTGVVNQLNIEGIDMDAASVNTAYCIYFETGTIRNVSVRNNNCVAAFNGVLVNIAVNGMQIVGNRLTDGTSTQDCFSFGGTASSNVIVANNSCAGYNYGLNNFQNTTNVNVGGNMFFNSATAAYGTIGSASASRILNP